MTEQDLLQKYNKERQEVECWTRVYHNLSVRFY